MQKSKSQKPKDNESSIPAQPRAIRFQIAVAIILLLAALLWMLLPSSPGPTDGRSANTRDERQPSLKTAIARNDVARKPAENPQRVAGAAVPQPMTLEQRVLVRSEWNSSATAFGLDKPSDGKEGATVGPSSVACANGNIYVLDNVNKRVLRYDENGKLMSSIALPTKGATDITSDSNGAVLVIDHYNDRIYKIVGNSAVLLGPVAMKDDFPIGTKFKYDTASNTLSAQDVDGDSLAKIDGNNLLLALPDGKELAVPFDAPVACVEEVMTDAKGIVWVLYTLEGDYRIRRVARVDPVSGSVGVAEVDVWFAFDATRHMAPAQNGIVLFAGDEREGRLVSFAYAGN